MKYSLSLALFAFAAAVASAQTAQPTPSQAPPAKKPVATVHQSEDEGQRAFDEHCSRCHNAPSGFSPSISGTIVRHMRVRASLSKHDEDAILHFLNP